MCDSKQITDIAYSLLIKLTIHSSPFHARIGFIHSDVNVKQKMGDWLKKGK